MNRWVLVLLAGSMGLNAGGAELYRWQDAQGRTHFSDQPPPGEVSAESLVVEDLPRARPSSGLRPGERAMLRERVRRRQGELTERRRANEAWLAARDRRIESCRETDRRLSELSRKVTARARREQGRLLRQRRKLHCFGDH